MNLFCESKFSDRVSSEKLLTVSAAGPPAFFLSFYFVLFSEITFLDLLDMPMFGTSPFSLHFVIFTNSDSAHMIRIEILRRTPVSMSQRLSPGLISIRENSNIVPWPECRPESPDDGGGDVPTTLPIW